MRRIGARISFFTLIVAAGLAATSIAAWAAPVDDARDSLWAIVNGASNQNQQVLNGFVAEALAASNADELDQARSRAHSNLDGIWYSSEAQLDAIASEFPTLAGDVANAKAQLVVDHDAAHSEVDDTYWWLIDSKGTSTTTTSTTTTSPSTTSTTVGPSTTTTVPRSTTTTIAPSTTTTVPRSTTTTTAVPSTTSTTVASTTTTSPDIAPVVAPPREPPPVDPETPDPVMPMDLALTPAMSMAMESGAAPASRGSDQPQAQSGRFLSAMLMSGSTVSLPPGLRTIALPPIVVLEVLVTTAFESVGTMLVPLLLLIAASTLIMWRELRRTRVAHT